MPAVRHAAQSPIPVSEENSGTICKPMFPSEVTLSSSPVSPQVSPRLRQESGSFGDFALPERRVRLRKVGRRLSVFLSLVTGRRRS